MVVEIASEHYTSKYHINYEDGTYYRDEDAFDTDCQHHEVHDHEFICRHCGNHVDFDEALWDLGEAYEEMSDKEIYERRSATN